MQTKRTYPDNKNTAPQTGRTISIYAPASVGNIGPGFDTLGMAVTGMGDIVTGVLEERPGTDKITSISGAWTDLPMDPEKNTATIAARILLDKTGLSDLRLTVSIQKGVPGSGLGSSAASSVAGALLGQSLSGTVFSADTLLEAAAQAEASVSGGYFLDNVSASLYGGVSVSSSRLKQSYRFGTISGLFLVFLIPRILLKTADSRKVLPKEVPLDSAIGSLSNTAGLLAAIHLQDTDLFCRMLQDPLIQPYRQPLIPYFSDLEKLSMESGARAFIISGAGSTMLAVTDKEKDATVLKKKLEDHVRGNNLPIFVQSSTIDSEGARHVASPGL